MDSVENNKLNNPPIKQVIVGLMFEKIFKSIDDIIELYENSKLKEIFSKKEKTQIMSFQLGDSSKLTQDIIVGLKLTNSNNSIEVLIEPNRILYVDNSKYIDYKTFISNFYNILNCFFNSSIKEFRIQEIGLRYINSFNLKNIDIGKVFYIRPTINLTNRIQGNYYAYIGNSLLVSNIFNSENNKMFATVKTQYNPTNQSDLINVIFDIDTHYTLEYTLSKTEDIENKLIELKKFKNEIFFSNFENAYIIKEFM